MIARALFLAAMFAWQPLYAMDSPPSQEKQAATPAPVKKVVKPKPKKSLPVIGYVEYVDVPGIKERVKAKLDTGATISSINAEVIKRFERDEKEFVVFRLELDEGVEQVMERELVRMAKVKKKEGGVLERPVVEMSLCIAGRQVKGEVNLSARDHFIYPVLIGRNMLMNHFLVDSAKSFTNKRRCAKSGA